METQKSKRLTAKQARILKLILDAIMLVLLVLMYKKQVISLEFHEIGGLALIGLFVVHHLVNARWIGASTRRLFAKGTPALVRARYIVDALLLIAFLTVGVTGVLISKVVFSIHTAGNFQTLHYFSAAVAVLLMGVHLGLHADYILGKLLRKSANKAAKVILAVVIAGMIAFGGYSLFTTSFVEYLAAPLQAARFAHGEFQPSGDIALDGSSGERPTDLSELPDTASGESGALPPQDGGNGGGPGGQGSGGGPGGGFGGGSGDGLGGGEGRGEQGGGGSTSAALLIAQYVSMMTLFGAATYGIVRLAGRKTKEKPVSDLPAVSED